MITSLPVLHYYHKYKKYMSIKQSKKASPKGKEKKSTAKMGAELREMIGEFLMENFAKFTEEVKKLEPKERVKVFCQLLPFIVPKLKTFEDLGPFERMPDDQLDHIIDELKKAA